MRCILFIIFMIYERTNMKTKYDLIVIGGGSGGIASAVRAATHGAKVAVIEQQHLGGTCVNVGCVPKKVMWYAAHIQSMINKAPDYGFHKQENILNWPALKQSRDQYIDRLRGLYAKRFESLNITHINGFGKLTAPNSITVNDVSYHAEHVIIATGGKPSKPNIPGIEHALTSDDFFLLEQQPKKVAIIGSGYIAVEIAGVLNALGSDTHLFCRKDMPLTHFDLDIRKQFYQQSIEDGLTIHALHSPLSLSSPSCIEFDKGSYEGFDAIFFAVGRDANINTINLDSVGIDTNST